MTGNSPQKTPPSNANMAPVSPGANYAPLVSTTTTATEPTNTAETSSPTTLSNTIPKTTKTSLEDTGSPTSPFPSAEGNANTKTEKNSLRRIYKEMRDIVIDPPGNCTAGPRADDMYDWIATITGPSGSPYSGGTFYLEIKFPQDYPYTPPKISFITRIYHCNISTKGDICLDTLKNNWSPALTISKVLLSVCSLLTDPNPYDPLVEDIAKQYLMERKQHDSTAENWTRQYAS